MTQLSRTPPTVSYDIKAILRPIVGRSYRGFTCFSCAHQIAMLNDTGAVRPAAAAALSVEVLCPHCGARGHYSTAALTTFTA